MILHQFPNIDWLRSQARSGFKNRTGVHGLRLQHTGWPTVVLNTTSSEIERKDILGTFSVFTNLSGRSRVRTEGLNFPIHSDTLCITNKGQYYDLLIPKNDSATTFNIHFGEKLFEETLYALLNKDTFLLDEPAPKGKTNFETYPRTIWKDDNFHLWIERLVRFYNAPSSYPSPGEREDEILSEFLEFVLLNNTDELKRMKSIVSLKPSTREELMKRVLRAIDFIHDNYASNITLDDLSQISHLSKFHLHRNFKQVKRCTPQQYIAQLRLHKAKKMIEDSELSFSQIALEIGFSELPAFSRFFANQMNVPPSGYKDKNSKLG
jgi:AraC family transcriptional regulator